MVYLNQHPGAQLIFTVRQHKMSSLVFQGSSVPAGEVTNNGDVERRNGFNVAAWNERDLRFMVIGEADANEIRNLVHEIKSANQ